MQNVIVRRIPFRGLALVPNSRCLATKPPKSSGPSQPPSPSPKASLPTATSPPESTSPENLSLDFSPVEAEDERTRTGAKSSKDSLSSIERRRRYMGRVTLAMLAVGALVGGIYLGREWEEDEWKQRKVSVEEPPSTRMGRTKTRFMDLFDFFSKPIWTELLPPPAPPYQKPYTLLLSIDDLLVTSTWDRVNGWRTAKRPGVDYFLAYMAQFYEIVIFTTQHSYTAIPITEKLDPYNFFITYKLFREATRSVDGQVVKDLSYLNRDLSKVIILDTVPEHVRLHPENSVIVPKWKGDPQDKGLVAMIPFLESIGIYKPADVRPILTAYQGKNIPIEYAKKEAEGKRQFIEEWRKTGKSLSNTGFTLSSLFSSSSSANTPEPLTYLELKRKEAQASYLEEQKYLITNREQLDKLLEDDRQAQMAQMSGSLWGAITSMASGQPQNKPVETPSGKGGDGTSNSKSPT